MKLPRRISLINEVAGSLREAIRRGEVRGSLPGVRSLSQDLHVSIPTVLGAIRVLEDEGLLKSAPGKRTRILFDESTGSLVQEVERKRQVVFLTFASNWLAGSLYYQSVMNELIDLGVHVQLFEYGVRSQQLQWENLERMVAQTVDCWVLLGAPEKVQVFFAERQLPCILNGIAAEQANIPDFQVDYPALYRHAVNYLQNRGHRRICLLTPEHSARINLHSVEIFRDLVMERLPDLPAWKPVRIYDGSAEHFRNLLRVAFDESVVTPTALVITTVKYVACAMTWLMRRGVKIPEDVSIISRDHDDVLDCLNPLPSHYRQPASASKRFVRSILAIMEKKHIRRHTRIMTDYFARDSVAPVHD